MPSQEQDYILKQIELFGRFLARLRKRRNGLDETDEADVNEALLLAMQLQEKNFGMPAQEFLRLGVDEQIATLQQGESKARGHERCLTYATLLRDTAELYTYRNNEELAQGARLLALHVALSVALDQPAGAETVEKLVLELQGTLGPVDLPAPTRELLERFEARR